MGGKKGKGEGEKGALSLFEEISRKILSSIL
jgi:hypothetical protein